MGISIHRQTDLGVPQYLHYYSRRHALYQQQSCARVPQVVKAALCETGAVQMTVDCLANPRRVKGFSDLGRKNEICVDPVTMLELISLLRTLARLCALQR